MLCFPCLSVAIDFLLVIFPLAYAAVLEKKKFRAQDFGFVSKGWGEDLNWTGKILAALLVFSAIISMVFSALDMNDFGPVKEKFAAISGSGGFALAYLLVVRVFTEEFFFRAFLVPRFGVLLPSVLFGALHFGYGSVLEGVGAFALGVILSIAYRQSARIMPNVAAHMLYNFIALTAILP